ncbi:MAG: esterase family protein [Bacteroidales bacterium]|jgi:enterochelin esterase-like enzyme|nr:esterase family protein [Bacteroidales bacterium]
MKKKGIITAALCAFFLAACSGGDTSGTGGPSGAGNFTVRYNPARSFYSRILGRTVSYSILLPQEYLDDDESRFGVVYLLHGWGGDNTSWGPSGLNIGNIADRLSASGKILPLIYVMPDGYDSYFCNKYDGSFNYMDMFTEELVPLIDKTLRTTAKASQRGVMGFSMGGFGAISLVSLNPDLFCVAAGLSPSLNTDAQYETLQRDGWDIQWGDVFGGEGTSGSSRITGYYKSQCPLHFFADNPSSDYAGIKYFISCGDDEERLYAGNGELHDLMLEKGIAHEYRVENGAHTEAYWIRAAGEALPFISLSFNDEEYPEETVRSFGDTGNFVEESLTTGGTDVDIILPSDYNADVKYRVLYFSKGGGRASITTKKVAVALDSLLREKRLIIAGFDPESAENAGIYPDKIISAVESAYNIESDPACRLGLAYGNDAGFLYEAASGDSPSVKYFFAEDADFEVVTLENTAELYYLDISDCGEHSAEMFDSFCALRGDGAKTEYRVRNGSSDDLSVMTGIYSMSYFIGSKLNKK